MFAGRASLLFIGCFVAIATGCAPAIGDSCTTTTDCSVNGDRICDRASPGGYCTVGGCEADTCPDGARCVEFRFDPSRLATRWCMARCSSSRDCRKGDGYRCLEASEIAGTDDETLARVLDDGKESAGFCAQPAAQ